MTSFAHQLAPAKKSPTSTVNESGRGNGQPKAPPRTFCNATTTEKYMGPAWTLRAGSDRAAAIPSRGTGC